MQTPIIVKKTKINNQAQYALAIVGNPTGGSPKTISRNSFTTSITWELIPCFQSSFLSKRKREPIDLYLGASKIEDCLIAFGILRGNTSFSTFKLLKTLYDNHISCKIKLKNDAAKQTDNPSKMLHVHQRQTTNEAHIHKHGIE
jgi:hypothetical protein